MKLLFNIREFLWVIVSEVEDWLYPYRDRLTPEERFEVRVKDPYTEEMYMVEELIQALNQKVDALQDDMIYVKHTNQKINAVEKALDRDNFMTPEQSLDWGIIDKIIDRREIDPSDKAE